VTGGPEEARAGGPAAAPEPEETPIRGPATAPWREASGEEAQERTARQERAVRQERKVAAARAARARQEADARAAGGWAAQSWAGLTRRTRARLGGVRLPRMRRSRIFLFLAILGPGVVAANAGNDAAGIATYASAGSQFVYRTLFFMVLVTVALVLVQEMAVRLGTYTGKGLAALIREQFSLRFTALALGCVLLANTGLVVS